MIEPINIRDASFILANLNEADHAETTCQFPAFDPVAVAEGMCATKYAFIARHDTYPAMVFGAHPMSATTVSAWALGTHRSKRVVPMVTRFCLGPLAKQLISDGYVWAEARSIVSHTVAHRWLEESMGAKVLTPLPGYGKDGEDFLLFRRAF